eukprot:4419167-Amphidinium_carterae.2
MKGPGLNRPVVQLFKGLEGKVFPSMGSLASWDTLDFHDLNTALSRGCKVSVAPGAIKMM